MTNLTNDALSKAIEALEEAKLRITELCICHSHPAPTATIERVEEALSALSALSQEARPVDGELESMTCMFHAACADLGQINEALGLDPDDGGAEPILDAIAELKEKADHPQPAQQDARDTDLQRLLSAASHTLRSYQYGNGSPDLAQSMADRIDAALAAGRGRQWLTPPNWHST